MSSIPAQFYLRSREEIHALIFLMFKRILYISVIAFTLLPQSRWIILIIVDSSPPLPLAAGRTGCVVVMSKACITHLNTNLV
jgi:hypothetical protein